MENAEMVQELRRLELTLMAIERRTADDLSSVRAQIQRMIPDEPPPPKALPAKIKDRSSWYKARREAQKGGRRGRRRNSVDA